MNFEILNEMVIEENNPAGGNSVANFKPNKGAIRLGTILYQEEFKTIAYLLVADDNFIYANEMPTYTITNNRAAEVKAFKRGITGARTEGTEFSDDWWVAYNKTRLQI